MNRIVNLNKNLINVKNKIYDKLDYKISNFINEDEGIEYDACRFELNGAKIICRSSKITPKKIGQFVTFWKRNNDGLTEPHSENDPIDFYVINVKTDNNFGQFVFPKAELIKKRIISTNTKEGKRGFRIYPKWDIAKNKQAIKTQNWQLKYFYEICSTHEYISKAEELYSEK